MEDRDNLKLAQATFNTLCDALEHHEMPFDKDEENLSIECKAQGEDFPMEVKIVVDPERMLIVLISPMPFFVPTDKRTELAIAVSDVNYLLVDGSFDYDITSGHMFFRMSNSFRESLISEEFFYFMLMVAFHTVDEFNDRFLMLAKGMLTLEQFVQKNHER